MLDTPPALTLSDLLALAPGRAHELCGPARRVLALWLIALLSPQTPVLWLRPRWGVDRLYPPGFSPWIDPARLIIAQGAKSADLLACTEDGLRSGACGLVLVELPKPPDLTPLRRLHLAAAEGLARRRTRDPKASLHALVLTPGMGGTGGVESRWHLAPCAGRQGALDLAWRLTRLRARMAPEARWRITPPHQPHLRLAPVRDLTAQIDSEMPVS
ncbi:MAG: ImuA family protein [Roseinatronobacter sp.]